MLSARYNIEATKRAVHQDTQAELNPLQNLKPKISEKCDDVF